MILQENWIVDSNRIVITGYAVSGLISGRLLYAGLLCQHLFRFYFSEKKNNFINYTHENLTLRKVGGGKTYQEKVLG